MTKPFQFTANGVLLLRSLPAREDGLARRLVEDLRVLSAINQSLPIEDLEVRSFSDFQILVRDLEQRARSSGYQPILHIDAHGSRSGLQFSDGSLVPWVKIVELLRRLNGAYRMNLVVSLGVCEGLSAILGLKGLERAPFALLLAPPVLIKSKDTESWARTVFSSVLQNKNFVEALKSANAQIDELSQFEPITFKELFDLGFNGYIEDHCDRAALRCRAARMLRGLRKSGRLLAGHGKSIAVGLLRSRRGDAERFWARFAWHDLGPDVANKTPYVEPSATALAIRRRPNGKSRVRILRGARRMDESYGRLKDYLQGVVDAERTLDW